MIPRLRTLPFLIRRARSTQELSWSWGMSVDRFLLSDLAILGKAAARSTGLAWRVIAAITQRCRVIRS